MYTTFYYCQAGTHTEYYRSACQQSHVIKSNIPKLFPPLFPSFSIRKCPLFISLYIYSVFNVLFTLSHALSLYITNHTFSVIYIIHLSVWVHLYVCGLILGRMEIVNLCTQPTPLQHTINRVYPTPYTRKRSKSK